MAKKNNFSIHTLNEYAKRISYSLAKRLYEAKTHLKFNKALFENQITEKQTYTFYMDNSVFYDYIGLLPGQNIKVAINELYDEHNLPGDFSCNDDGIVFMTYTPEDYELVLICLEELGIPTDIINDNIDQNYLNS